MTGATDGATAAGGRSCRLSSHTKRSSPSSSTIAGVVAPSGSTEIQHWRRKYSLDFSESGV